MPSLQPPTLRRSQRWFLLLLLVLFTVAGVCWRALQVSDARDLAEARIRQHFENENFEAAQTELLRLHQAHPRDVTLVRILADLAFRRSRPIEGIAWLEELAATGGTQRVDLLFEAGTKAMSAGLVSHSERLLRKVVSDQPTYRPARDLLIRLYWVTLQESLMRDQIAEQNRLAQSAEQVDAQPLLLYCIGSRFDWSEEDHIPWLQAGLAADPGDVVARAALADYLILRNRREDARRVLQDGKRNGSDIVASSRAWRLAVIEAEDSFASGDLERCNHLLTSLPLEANQSPRVWLLRGRVWSELEGWSAANTAFANAARLDPFDPAAVTAQARVAQKLGHTDVAQKLFARAQTLARLLMLVTKSLQFAPPSSDALRELENLCDQLEQPQFAVLFRGTADSSGKVVVPSLSQDARTMLTAPSQIELAIPRDVPVLKESISAPSSLTTALKVRATVPQFVDVAEQSRLDFIDQHVQSDFHWLMETLGGGVAVVDFDGDNWPDLFFTQGCELPVPKHSGKTVATHRLFRNVGGKSFEDVTTNAGMKYFGYGQGCVTTDFDNDGFADLLVCHYGEIVLYRNQGDGTFADVTQASGLNDHAWSTSAAWGDFDRDGDLDLYVVHYVQAPFEKLKPCGRPGHYEACRPHDFAAEQDAIWENLGDGRFANRTIDSGVIAPDGKGLGVVVRDFDQDGWPDIFVGNDTTANFLFHNRGQAASPFSFEEVAQIAGVAFDGDGRPEACMGISSADVDGDGQLDLFVTNFQDETNTFYRHLDGGLLFADQTDRAGLADASRQTMGWGSQFFDADGDGWLDLFVANGHLVEPPQLPQFFVNRGQGRFSLASERAGAYFQRPQLGRAVAICDWNGDQKPDVVVTHLSNRAALLENRGQGQFLELRLIGTQSNRTAEGAVVMIGSGIGTRMFPVSSGGGYFSSNESLVRIGMNDRQTIDELTIQWPSGRTQTLRDLSVNAKHCVIE